jgi:hypothetical protein
MHQALMSVPRIGVGSSVAQSPPGPESLGPRTWKEKQKTVWDSKLGLEIKKSLGFKTLFGNQKNVWGSKLGPVTSCLKFVHWRLLLVRQGLESLGPRTFQENQTQFGIQNLVWQAKIVWGSKLCLGIKKMFGVQNLVR